MTKSNSSWQLLPPPLGCCHVCAIKHDPKMPHDRQSLFYQTHFNLEHGRAPTWADAVSHCSEPIKEAWQRELTAVGHWSEPKEVDDPTSDNASLSEVETILMLVLDQSPTDEQLAACSTEELNELFAWAAREHLMASDWQADSLPRPECLDALLNSSLEQPLQFNPFSEAALRTALEPALVFLIMSGPDKLGFTRAATADGKAALEIEPNQTCLYVQNFQVSAAELVRNAAGLLQLLTHFFPEWDKSKIWLNTSLASKVSEERMSRESKLICLRKTLMGVFLTISGPELSKQ